MRLDKFHPVASILLLYVATYTYIYENLNKRQHDLKPEGRIIERRSDLSPFGCYFFAFDFFSGLLFFLFQSRCVYGSHTVAQLSRLERRKKCRLVICFDKRSLVRVFYPITPLGALRPRPGPVYK